MSRTPGRARGTRRAARRAIGPAALVLALASAGCGIRATDVPVDGGPAPTRATCDAPAGDAEGIDVYLVCGAKVKPVRRPVQLPGSDRQQDRTATANALLDELQEEPVEAEKAAGFRTDVPPKLSLWGPVTGDDVPVLRLSEDPGKLQISALIQIICTFSTHDALSSGHSVMLDGPPNSTGVGPKAYPCSAAKSADTNSPEDDTPGARSALSPATRRGRR